jgi:hypothetical protein
MPSREIKRRSFRERRNEKTCPLNEVEMGVVNAGALIRSHILPPRMAE